MYSCNFLIVYLQWILFYFIGRPKGFSKKYNYCICTNPCIFVNSRAFKTSETINNKKDESVTTIYFQKYIKVVHSFFLYSFLSVVAEIGGYVGLFLGVSVNQIPNLMDTIFDWTTSKYYDRNC